MEITIIVITSLLLEVLEDFLNIILNKIFGEKLTIPFLDFLRYTSDEGF